jgi:hypothetical protein
LHISAADSYNFDVVDASKPYLQPLRSMVIQLAAKHSCGVSPAPTALGVTP